MSPDRTGGSHPTGEGGTESRFDRLLADLDAVEVALWIVVVAALVLDVALTHVGLQHGFAEGNPVLGPAMESHGFGALAGAKLGALAVGGLSRVARPEYGAVIPLGLALPWLGAVVVNTIHLAPVLTA